MKRVFACVCLLLAISSIDLKAQEPLTNDTIVKLVKAGISDDTIVGMVYQQVGKYALSADDVAALKTAGVSERIIAAMVVKGGPSAANKTSGQPSEPHWKDRAEYDLVQAIMKEQNPSTKLELLNNWKRRYPTSEFVQMRNTLFIQTYNQMRQPDKVIVAGNEALQANPQDFLAMYLMALNVQLLPKPTAEELAAGEKAGDGILANEYTVFDPSKKPSTTTDTAWAESKTQAEVLAHTTLGWIALQKNDDATAEKELTKALTLGPNSRTASGWPVDSAQISSWLGTAIAQEAIQQKKPEMYPQALFQFARAASLDPAQGGLPPAAQKGFDTYFVDAYTRFHGQDAQGIEQLRELAKAQPFPPAGFTISDRNQPVQSAAGFSFKVLQSESVPYVVQTGGGISTNCQISGSTNTNFSATTMGNSTFGNATINPNLRMNCSSTDNTVRWTHVLNAMLVEASDGNAYIIACDRAWRWSKCSTLRPGDVFPARQTDKGFVVQFLNAKSEEKEATYSVLQAKSLR
ncbi:MAG TPA: hypothetical protein VK335_11290 [Bryobacteraceae bacterium]|nr:hypothetical protein [Bryobacteraceae bacterium]